MQQIKNVILDLGGVLLDIDFKKAYQSFNELGVTQFAEMYGQSHCAVLFEKLETGMVTPVNFYKEFREITGCTLADESIRNAWNSLLLTFPKKRIEWLLKLKEKYNVYLFSNTNQIHYEAFTEIFTLQYNGQHFDDLFVAAFYSHKIGVRKPYKDAFLTVLELAEIKAEESIFIDDTMKNIEGAKSAGLYTAIVTPVSTVLELDLV